MPRDWDHGFTTWAAAPGQTELDRCENAVRAIRTAIDASGPLTDKGIKVFPQGSYRNRTNVRVDSDVDVCVLCTYSVFYEIPLGTTPANFGLIAPGNYPFPTYRADVGAALTRHFGAQAVRAGSKAFDIRENTYRISADAVPCFEFQWHHGAAMPTVGTAFIAGGERTINYPEQHYANGVAKNDSAARQFKAMVRILKNLRNELRDAGDASANGMASFLLESLVWNVPDPRFRGASFRESLHTVLAVLITELTTDEQCATWAEINGIKYLFHASQPWRRENVRAFLIRVWQYVGY